MLGIGRARRQLDGLIRLTRTASAAGDVDVLLRDVVPDLVALMEADRSTLYVVDADQLWSRVSTPNGPLEIRLAIGQGLAGWCAQMGLPVRIDDVLKDDRFDARWDKKSGYRTRTMLCQPIKDAAGATIGVVQCLNKRSGAFDDSDQSVLTAAAAVCGLAITAARARA